jgi:spore coat protein U-like protein
MRASLKLISLLGCFFALASLQARATTYCDIRTAGVAFGNYDPLAADRRDTIGIITVTCTGSVGDRVSYSLLLNATGQSGAYRAMTNGVYELNYILYTDNGYTQFWGDGTGGSVVVNDSYTMDTHQTSRSYPMYGRIPAGQNQATAGAYSGNITITMTY